MTTAAGLAMLVALAVVGCDGLPGQARAREKATTSAAGMDVSALYQRQCAGCHGTEGRLGAARPLNDPIYLALVPRERLRRVIAEGVPGTAQPSFGPSAGGALSEPQIDALVQGLLVTWAQPDATKNLEMPPYSGALGDPDRGHAVYTAACAGCHGADGRGGPTAPSVVDPSYLALVSDQHLRTTVIAGRADLGMPDWRGDMPGRPLGPGEVSDIVAFLVARRGVVPGR
jgi:mono/diheme cytochrome c family protein